MEQYVLQTFRPSFKTVWSVILKKDFVLNRKIQTVVSGPIKMRTLNCKAHKQAHLFALVSSKRRFQMKRKRRIVGAGA